MPTACFAYFGCNSCFNTGDTSQITHSSSSSRMAEGNSDSGMPSASHSVRRASSAARRRVSSRPAPAGGSRKASTCSSVTAEEACRHRALTRPGCKGDYVDSSVVCGFQPHVRQPSPSRQHAHCSLLGHTVALQAYGSCIMRCKPSSMHSPCAFELAGSAGHSRPSPPVGHSSAAAWPQCLRHS